MATVYDFLNPDSTEVEEQRIIRAPGATTGDVLTVQADKTVSPAPGGGSQTAIGTYIGSATVTVANGNAANLPFDSLIGGTALLDLTTPDQPKVLTAGTYVILAQIQATADLTAGGFIQGQCNGVGKDFTALAEGIHPFEAPTQVTLIDKFAAGGAFQVAVANNDGVASRDFVLYACQVCKL